MTRVAATMEAFFTERLINQRRASPHTVASYRDSLRMLVSFAQRKTGVLRPGSTSLTWTQP